MTFGVHDRRCNHDAYGVRNFILDSECVGDMGVVAIRPNMRS